MLLSPFTLLSLAVIALNAWSSARAQANTSASRLGNAYNFWTYDSDGFDLTRGNSSGAKNILANEPITVDPSRSALVIIDMQNFFLHPNLTTFPAGLAAIQPTVDLVHAFRAAGSKVIWCQWGLSEYDLLAMPPGFLLSFASGGNPNMTMGDEMGLIDDGGSEVDMGRKLVRGSWNAQQYGPLWDLAQEGIANGTDFYFPKNRLSCFWGAQTPGGQFIQDNLISTLFISGVNTDQCVFGTLVDAAYKGYDTMSATGSPEYATEMVLFNARGMGFVANSTEIITGLSA